MKGFRRLGEPLFSLGLTRRLALGTRSVAGGGPPAPTVAITSTESSPTTLSPIPITITFSEAVTGFAVGDITAANGSLSNFAGSGTTYTVDLTPAGTTAMTLDIAAGVCVSAATGAANAAADQFSITSSRTFYFVRKDGNDTTGNGSSATPWLTIDKAVQTVPIGGGHTIKVGAGTYAESRFNMFYLNKSYTNLVIIEPESDTLGDVVVRGNTGTTTSVNFEGAGNIRFNKLDIVAGASTSYVIWIIGNNSNLSFTNCTITSAVSTAGRGPVSILNGTAGSTTTGVTFSNCTINAEGSATIGFAVQIETTNITANISNITIDNCTFPELADAAQNTVITVKAVNGGTGIDNVDITNCTITSTKASPVIYIGHDVNPQSAITNVTVSGCTLTCSGSTSTHGIETGFGVNGAVLSGNTISSTGYAFVIKECTNVELATNIITGGADSGIYFKSGTTSNAHNNTITVSAGVGFRLARNLTTNNKVTTWQFQNNTINVSGTGKALSIGTDTDDAGDGICDYNQYQSNSGLGVVRSDANVANLTELQAAWSDYPITTNDSHSTVV